MNCPFCSHEETKVVDKRLSEDGRNRRRRECMKCGKRFTTYEKAEGLLTKVKKRDGSIMDFDKEKITNAIWAAAQAVGGQDKETAIHLSEKVVEKLEEKFGGVTIPTVEQIQDIVEKTLVEDGHYKTAKAYILYREQHKKLRETKSVMVDVVNTIGEYLDQTDWRVKENSNEAFSFSGLLLHTAGKVMSYYNLNQMYTPEIAEAHKNGYFHIHDLSHGVIGYCCGHSLKNLLIMGFGGVRNKTECKPAKHLSTVVHQMVNYIGCLQMEFAGAQAFSVHPKETVIVRDRAGNISVERIGDFCDRFVEGNPERWLGPNGIEFADISNMGYETLSFGEDGKSQWRPIKRAIRHPVTDPLHLLKTNKGIISASKSHSLFSLNSHQYLGLKEKLLLESMENNGKKLFSYELGERAKTLGIDAPEKVVQKLVAKGLLDSALLNYDGEARHFAKYTVRENKKRFVLKKTEELNKLSKEVKTGDTGASNLAVLSKVSLPENEEVDLYDIIRESRELRKLVLVKIDDTKQLKKDIMAKTSMRKLSFELKKSRGYVYSMLKRGKVPFEIYDKFTSVKEKGIKFTTNRSANAISRVLKGEELTSFVKLIAWYLSEGYGTKYWIGIVQKDENNIREILRILDSLSMIYHISKRNVKSIIVHGIVAAITKELCSRHSDNKKIPSFVFALDSRLKKAFLEEIVKGDGTKTERGWIYTSTSNRLITGLNFITTSLGLKTSIKMKHTENFEGRMPGRLTRYDLVINTGITSRIEACGDFESAVIFENQRPDFGAEYEYDLSVEGTESFVGGVGLFAMHNSSVDTLLAPFIRTDNLSFKDVKQAMQQLVFSLNIPSRWGCFSEDTEILTDKGWKKGIDLDVGEAIATFNTKTEKIEYLPVLKMTKNHYSGKMINLRNRITDQLVTPNHRVLRRIHNFQEGISPSKYVFEEAAKLKTKIPLIPLGGNFVGNEMSEDTIKLLSWIVSEGSLCEDERIAIHQSAEVNPENCEEIRGILGRLDMPFDESMKLSGFTGKRNCIRFRLNRPVSKSIYNQFFPSYNKTIPRMLGGISTGLTRMFLDTYMKADGWPAENKIYTKKKEDAEMMQEMIAKAGWGSTLLLNKNGIYVVRVIKHNYTQVDEMKEVDYDGMVWCPTTVNGTVVVRRNGKVFVSGNSQYPFSNITFDWVPPEDMKDQKAIVGGKEMPYTYGELQKEMDTINKAFLEVMLEGDAKGGVFTFPIPTFNLTKDFNWDSENAKLLFEMTAKYGLPYFQNYISSGLDPRSIRAMCCRLNINQKELMTRPGGMWGPGDSSISGDTPVYINAGGSWQLKQIADVYENKLKNFKTLSFNPLTSEIEEARVKNCVKHGTRDVFRLKTNQGIIKITEDHCMFNVSDGGDIVNASLDDIKERRYFIAPKSHIVGSMYKLNVAEELIKNGFADSRARILVTNENLFSKIVSSEEAKTFIKNNYKKKFTDIKCNWKHSNFRKPTIAFNLFGILYRKGIIRQSDLKDMFICKIKYKLPLIVDLNYDTGLIAGLFLAEGSMHEACLVCNNNEKLLDMCANAAERIFKCNPVVYIPKPRIRKVGSVTFNSAFVANYLKLGFGLSGHSSTKKVPDYIPNSNADTIKGLIDGYYLGDGYKSKEYIELTTVSKDLAEGLILLLKRIGSRFALKEDNREGKKRSYNIRIFDYNGRAVSFDRKYGKDIRHLLGLFRKGVAELRKELPTKRAIELGLPQPFYNMHYMPRENTVIRGFEILKRNNLMNGYFNTLWRFLENYERVDVLDVAYAGKDTVYDLSVPEHENFVAGNGMFFTHNTGSIGVVTLNVNRLAYEARKAAEETKTDNPIAKAKEEYFNKLRYYMTLAKNSLETKREVVEKNLASGLMPYTKRYLGTFRNHFSTIGLCGMNEACLNLLGRDIASQEGKQFTIDTLMFMREMCLQFQKETGNLYNLEATPAESTAYRFGRLDMQHHPGIITAGTNEPYLTNSTHLPVNYTDDPILAIEHQNDIQPLYTGGTIFHLFLGERMTSGEACKSIVRKIAENTRLPYFTITPTFSVCPEHGYVKGEHFNCPIEVDDSVEQPDSAGVKH